MELGLAGKVAIVTGAGAGIGFACARALYGEGVHVVLAEIDPARLDRAAASLRASTPTHGTPDVLPVQMDVREAVEIERAVGETVQRFGRVDILVNNAGGAQAGAFLDLPDAAWMEAWNFKLLGYIRATRAVAPHMIAQRDGRIVNIVGGAARTPGPWFLPGGTVNAAILNFSKGISKELAPHGVRVNAISPDSVRTERSNLLARDRAAALGMSVEEGRAREVAAIPTGRLVEADEIAALVLLLVSDRVPSLTGAEIIIDGGQTPGV